MSALCPRCSDNPPPDPSSNPGASPGAEGAASLEFQAPADIATHVADGGRTGALRVVVASFHRQIARGAVLDVRADFARIAETRGDGSAQAFAQPFADGHGGLGSPAPRGVGAAEAELVDLYRFGDRTFGTGQRAQGLERHRGAEATRARLVHLGL